MKHRGDRTTDAERNGRNQETAERQASVWTNTERQTQEDPADKGAGNGETGGLGQRVLRLLYGKRFSK